MYRIIDNNGIKLPQNFNTRQEAEKYIAKIVSNYEFFNHIHIRKEDWYFYIKSNEQMVSFGIIKE